MIRSLSIVVLVSLGLSVQRSSTIPDGPTVRVLDGMYHLASCPVVAGKATTTVSAHEAIRTHLKYCQVCDPISKDAKMGAYARDYGAAINRELIAVENAQADEEVLAAAKRAANAPVVRVPEAQMRAIATAALAADPSGDLTPFQQAFTAEVSKRSADFSGQSLSLVPSYLGDNLAAEAYGPMSNYYVSVSALVRKLEPIAKAAWVDGVTILVTPKTISAPNIEKVVVQRDGQAVQPLLGELKPTPFTTAMGATRTLNAGAFLYPVSAFERGADVRVILIPEAGNNIVTSLAPQDFLRLR